MSRNLVVFKWNNVYSDKAFRKKMKIKLSDIAADLLQGRRLEVVCQDHNNDLLQAVSEKYNITDLNSPDNPFICELHKGYIVFNIPESRHELYIPGIGYLAMSLGYNSVEA